MHRESFGDSWNVSGVGMTCQVLNLNSGKRHEPVCVQNAGGCLDKRP